MIRKTIFNALIFSILLTADIFPADSGWPNLARSLNLSYNLHYNFGNTSSKWSYALAMSFWYTNLYKTIDGYSKSSLLKSFDIGFEGDFLERSGYNIFKLLRSPRSLSAYRIYAEFQCSPVDDIPSFGYSIGPVLELSSPGFGIQASFWANPLIGLDIRGRLVFEKELLRHLISPGYYVSIPAYFSFRK